MQGRAVPTSLTPTPPVQGSESDRNRPKRPAPYEVAGHLMSQPDSLKFGAFGGTDSAKADDETLRHTECEHRAQVAR